MSPRYLIAATDWSVGMLRRLLVSLVVVVSLAGCDQYSPPVSNETRLAQSKWFIGVAVIGLLLAAWASWHMARDERSRRGYGERRKRHANKRNRA
jgi:hypothetical protein